MRKAGAARREVRCAVGLPNVGPTGDPRLLAALAAEAEAAGWDGFFVWDHVLYREPGAGGRTGRRAGDPGTAVFVRRMAPAGPGVLRLAVKDVVDVAGVPTTAGSRLLAETEGPAEADAACLAGARAAGAAVVGKTNLVELAFGASGINPWFGTPPNPLDPSLVPGGSSSGSAVAVATGEADVAYGTDTAGSIRVPSACCGTAGLKTTFGRLPLSGVRPLSPSLDTVGPMARDVAGLVVGMALLEPGFRLRGPAPAAVGRLRLPGDPAVDRAADGALARAGIVVVEAEDPGWGEAWRAAELLLVAEAGASTPTSWRARSASTRSWRPGSSAAPGSRPPRWRPPGGPSAAGPRCWRSRWPGWGSSPCRPWRRSRRPSRRRTPSTTPPARSR